MLRVRLIVTGAAVAAAAALAGCSGSSLSMPDWLSLSSKPSAPAPQTLQFESDPPGADVRTAQGQTCQTPCALNVPAENQAVTFAKTGYLPQTVQVTIRIPEHSMFENPAPDVQPNPVAVVLQAAGPPKKPPPKLKPKVRPPAATPASAAPAPAGASPFPPPPPPQR